MILVEALAVYALIGVAVAPAFVIFGIARVMPEASLTSGARLMLLPGAAALWPLILTRWLEAGGRR
jgi:hypothetical protein